MEVHDADKGGPASGGSEPRLIEHPVTDPLEQLSAVYRDYPGLRALILRRVRDPHLAADILQDAAVTTLEKLRAGEISQANRIGGYLFRVALNHLRNYRRKDRTALSSSEALESLSHPDENGGTAQIDSATWARVARDVLRELPTPRDRDLLERFYLKEESKEDICRALDLTEEHFNRVIFRARNRFRELLERRGYTQKDLLTWTALVLGAGSVCAILTEGCRVSL